MWEVTTLNLVLSGLACVVAGALFRGISTMLVDEAFRQLGEMQEECRRLEQVNAALNRASDFNREAHREATRKLHDAVAELAELQDYTTRLLDSPNYYASERETIESTTAPGIPADAACSMGGD